MKDDLCQKWRVQLILQGTYKLSGTGIAERLKIIDIGCSGVARILCQGGTGLAGHRFGVVKRPKIINVCRTTPDSTVYSSVCVIALGLCVIHIQ